MNFDDLGKKVKDAADALGTVVKEGTDEAKIRGAYQLAKEAYAPLGIDVDAALKVLADTPISIHCWQGDDVGGFEKTDSTLDGGLAVTGNYPGKARNSEELFADMSKAFSLIPGTKKANVHASYITSADKPDRNAIEPRNYDGWVDWANSLGVGLDFNSTYFAHPKAANGTLTNPDESIRSFWVEHGKRVRQVGQYMGMKTGKLCVINHWIADGCKETPIDTIGPRQRLIQSCDEIFADQSINKAYTKDSVESKLFGIGSEAYVPGSHEFYMGYAISRRNTMVTLDAGHFHPTESIAAKISAMLCFMPELLLHVSRPIRWDSDHVVIMDDELQAIMKQVVRCNALNRTYLALDYFDASINRVAAWVIGTRNTQKALLSALLEPTPALAAAEAAGDTTARLALTEEYKSYPMGAVWDYFCLTNNVPVRGAWLNEVKKYEAEVLSKR